MPGLILQARAQSGTAAPGCRIGFTATRKIGNAVVRNRVKRRLRALADALLPRYGQTGYDYVVVGRMSTATRPFAALRDDFQTALTRVHRK